MSIDEKLKENLIADVENICGIELDEETKEMLKRSLEITIGVYGFNKENVSCLNYKDELLIKIDDMKEFAERNFKEGKYKQGNNLALDNFKVHINELYKKTHL